MQYLEREDLKTCRLVSKFNHEATRLLFRTLYLRPNLDSCGRACKIMLTQPLTMHVQGFDYDGRVGWDGHSRLKDVIDIMEALHQFRPKGIFLTYMAPDDVAYMLSPVQAVNRFLCKTRQLKFTIDNGRDDHWSFPESGKRFRKLANQLATVSELHLGLAFSVLENHFIDFQNSRLRWNKMLQGYFPRLVSLTLENVVDNEGCLLSFLKRHAATLKSLTLENLILSLQEREDSEDSDGIEDAEDAEETEDADPTASSTGLKAVIRFIVLLNKQLSLEKIDFQGVLWAGNLNDSLRKTGIYVFNDKKLAPGIVSDSRPSLRHRVKEYVCHRAVFPFPILNAWIEDLMDGRLESFGGDFVIMGEDGADIRITAEHDQSWGCDWNIGNAMEISSGWGHADPVLATTW